MISRIDHVSIAVPDQKKAEQFFRDILGAVPGVGAPDEGAKFFWQIFSLGDLSRLEIVSPTGQGSFLDGFIKSRQAGVHHITLQTPDLGQAISHLEAHGIPFFGHNEYPGGVWKEIFIHPRHAFGVLIQIAEFKPEEWLSEKVRLPAGIKWQLEKTATGANLVFAHPGGGKAILCLDRKQMEDLRQELSGCLSG